MHTKSDGKIIIWRKKELARRPCFFLVIEICFLSADTWLFVPLPKFLLVGGWGGGTNFHDSIKKWFSLLFLFYAVGGPPPTLVCLLHHKSKQQGTKWFYVLSPLEY